MRPTDVLSPDRSPRRRALAARRDKADVRIVVAGEASVAGCLRRHGILESGVGPPLVRTLPRVGNHRRQHHEHVRRQSLSDDRCGESPERMADHDTAPSRVCRGHDGIRVIGESEGPVIARQVGCDHLMSALPQDGGEPMP